LFRVYEIPERGLADRISINTNSQTAVKPRDLRSNDKVMVGLKRAFEARYPDGFFMTKRGEDRPANKDAKKTVDAGVLAKMLMAWHCQRPNISYNEKKLFDEYYKTLFRTGYDPTSIFALQIWLNALDEAWPNLALNHVLKAGRAYVKFHLLFSISSVIAAVNKQPAQVVEPSATLKAAQSPGAILPLAANCLENALQYAINQAQIGGRVFSPQNGFPNGKALLDLMRVPAGDLSNRWAAE
jgi:AIPR protein